MFSPEVFPELLTVSCIPGPLEESSAVVSVAFSVSFGFTVPGPPSDALVVSFSTFGSSSFSMIAELLSSAAVSSVSALVSSIVSSASELSAAAVWAAVWAGDGESFLLFPDDCPLLSDFPEPEEVGAALPPL